MTLDKSLRFNEQRQCLAVPLVLEVLYHGGLLGALVTSLRDELETGFGIIRESGPEGSFQIYFCSVMKRFPLPSHQ